MQVYLASAPKYGRILWLALIALLLPTPLAAQAQGSSDDPGQVEQGQAFVDPFEEEAPRPATAPDSDDDGDRPRLGSEERPYEEFPERRVVEERPQREAAEHPDGPVELRFRFDEPMRFDVSATSRMGFEDRPGLRQFYQSGMAVEYRPITELQRAQLPAWQMQIDAAKDNEVHEEHQILLASIFRFSGSFNEPRELSDTARTHQLLKDAHFSFRVSDRGEVSDVKIHPPTNPLVRSSMEEMIRLLVESHPVLPDEAIEPGDSWTQSIKLEADDESVVRTQDVELEYTFNDWTRCGPTYCARIDVEQSVNAAGRYTVRNVETRSATDGSGSGWFLLDPRRGRIIRSHWTVDSQGDTNVRRRKEDTIEEVTSIRFNLSVETTIRLIERPEPTYRLVPVDDQD